MSSSDVFRPRGPRLPPALALLAALSLGACASTSPGAGPPAPMAAAAGSVREDASPYGLFLAGEAALDDDANHDATDYFVRAGHADAEDLIRQKAFLAAVASGEVDKAAALAPSPGQGGQPLQKLAALVRAVDALSAGRNKEAFVAVSKDPGGFAYLGGFALAKPWMAMAAGETAAAVQLPDTGGQRLNRLAALLSRSLIYERLRRYEDAEAGYKTLTANSQLASFYVLPYGAFLERRGRPKDAMALYKKFQARAPKDRELQRAIARVDKHRPAPPQPTLKEGAAGALISAAELALVEKSIDEGEVYLRLGLRLDPQNAEGWILLGDVRSAAGAYADARQSYGHVPATSDNWIEARERIIASYQNAGDHDTALALAQELAKAAPNERDAQLALADALREKMDYEGSAKVLSAVMSSDPAAADWTLYYLRGTSLSQAGHWPEAEKDLVKALTLQPDEPDVLNYLGYSWVDKGEKLQQAMAMLQKAATASPQSGEIADSLGWAYYRLGDYRQAVASLERAVALNAVSAEINDHLGDAYWQVGRRAEAQYQWRRVLGLQPNDMLRTSAQKKLTSGLDMPPSAVAQG